MTTIDPDVTGRRQQGAARKGRPKKKTKGVKKHEPPEGSPFMTIPAFGKKFFGLSKNGSYDAAERGDFGELYEVGRRKFVVVPALQAKIKAAAEAQQSKSTSTAA
jgi:hypothetical protein